ncbi:hypothetical protein NDU88_003989 [Pleurodeles waltl]|uniref:Uncharacterized protein n=1 Tax=Pleurodeles waltl TaxID=8319 RepID=A0AAV7TQ86_PLEWA|nr:hypothetical protein NDU88_003989 [Pleurodeles waltl]
MRGCAAFGRGSTAGTGSHAARAGTVWTGPAGQSYTALFLRCVERCAAQTEAKDWSGHSEVLSVATAALEEGEAAQQKREVGGRAYGVGGGVQTPGALRQGAGLLVLPSGEDLVTPASGPGPIQDTSPGVTLGAVELQSPERQAASQRRRKWRVGKHPWYLLLWTQPSLGVGGAVLEEDTDCTNLVSNNCTLGGKFSHWDLCANRGQLEGYFRCS